jgi:tyrosine-protein kinase Etk/Wzc
METTQETNITQPHSTANTVVLDVLFYVGVVWRSKFRLMGWGVLGMALFYGLSYTRPKLYESEVKFMPPQRSVSSPLLLSIRANPGDEYRAMLTSNGVADDVVQHLDLVHVLKAKDDFDARKMVRAMTKFAINTNDFVTITTTDKDPKLAARIANEYFAALYRLTQRIASDESKHRLDFLSGPLQAERDKLYDAESQLRDAEVKTGLVLPGAQAALGVQQVATLRGRINDLETQLALLRTSSTDENPAVINLRSQITSLQDQIAGLEKAKGSQSNSPAQLPGLSMEVQRAQREVTFHTGTMEALTRGLSTTSMQDSYTPSLSLIDPGEVARVKSSPSRTIWALVGGTLFFLIAIGALLIRTIFQRWRSSPSDLARYTAWKRALSGLPAEPGHAG